MIAKSHRWQKTALAAAAAAVLGLWGTHASALSLGRIAVLSALGEPLRAEIDIPDINAEEAASLKASVASPEAFRAAGMDYNASMSGLQITLQKRPDGRSFLRVSSDRAINDPYVDLILEASWSSGRIVRDYTMLFDPPNLRQPQAVTATVPQVSPAPSRVAPTPRAATPSPAPASDAGRTAAPRPAARPAPEAPPKAATTSPAKQLTVKSGDTASKLVAANRPAGVSLDQMLVAMLRANPDAFIGGNINRLRSGAVVDLPGAEDAQATPADEARQIVLAQSKDFNEFRRKLAGNAPVSQVASADRRASGKVEAQVEDKKSAAATPDKLTLSKGAVQTKGGEEKIAQERSAKEAASRAEELSKNIAELSKLSAAAAPAPVASAPQAAAPTPAPAASEPAAAASAAVPAVTASAPATEASAPAPAPVASAPVKRPAAVPMPMEEPSLLDELLDNPLVPAAAAGLLALLAGLGVYRVRQRKQAAQMDSSFLESRLQPDSFFGASGGQRVDTHDSGANGSSMVYSPSQLEAADDVDPVAEADVYLAYGRDLQAEEILKEALRLHPDRVAIHLKLLEIYAKRRDVRNFESSAADAHRLTGGAGADWNRVCELGLGIDPGNTLFQPGGQPASASGSSAAVSEPIASTPQASPQVAEPAVEPAASAVDLDLDLDFSLDEEPAAAKPAATGTPAAAPAPESTAPDLDLNFELPTASIQGADNSLDFEPPSLPEPSTRLDSPAATSGSAPTAAADTGALEFDLGSLSLDLGEATTEQTGASDDPLATKLALAEEFSAIGDADGARALIEEIIAEATGDMKTKAQEALSKLN